MNKKGMELTIGSIVIMILAGMLLVFLILFFTLGSGEFLSKIKSYFSGSNADSVVDGCNIYADSNRVYAYCCEKKEVRYYEGKEKKSAEFSCVELLDKGFIGKRIKNLSCEEVEC